MKKRSIAALAGVVAAGYFARRYAEMQALLAVVPVESRSPILPLTARSLSERSLWMGRLGMRVRTKPGHGVTVAERYLGSHQAVRVLITTPTGSDERRPAVLHLHGGGMVVGSPQFEAFESGRLARKLDAVVVSPDYRLAPEHPFPAALDDCMATLRWMRDNAAELGIDCNRIAVMGSSAGGGLSAAVAQRSSDEGIDLRAQVLVYPMLDDRTALLDHHGARGRFMWTPASSWWPCRACITARTVSSRKFLRCGHFGRGWPNICGLTCDQDLLRFTSLKGTPRSAAASRGKPRTRSPMMLRAISVVPPPSAAVCRDR
jgi:acetyl esterase/lipase